MIIYKITNLVNKKIYIGQTKKSLEERWAQHIRNSKKRIDKGILCLAIKKYGPEKFKIEKIDSADSKQELDTKEWFFASMLNSYAPFGYNLDECGGSKRKSKITIQKKIKKYKFISPNNEIIEINNLSEFCKENNLLSSQMYRVFSLKRESHKGWRSCNGKNKIYVMKNLKSGNIYKFLSCYGFKKKIAEALNISQVEVSHLLHGRSKNIKNNILEKIELI